MTSAVSRELKFTYGTFVVGGTTEHELHGAFQWEWDYDRFAVSFDVIVRADTEALFNTACSNITTEFRKRDQRFKMELGAQTIHDYNPSDASGLNIVSRCRKGGDLQTDSGRARLYTVSIAGELPATDLDGRRENRISIRFDASRRAEMTFSGVWTQVGTDSASTKYLADSPAWMASALGSFLSGRTMKMFSERYEPDRNDDTVNFEVVWRELIATGTASVLNHANIEDQTFQVKLNKPAPGDSFPGVVRLRECIAHFECSVNKEENVDLDTLWTDTILPYMDEQVQAIYGPDQIARVDEDGQHIPTSNRIVAVCAYRLAIGATNIVEARVSVSYDDDPGLDFTPAWTSNPEDCYVDQGPRVRLRIGERTLTVLGIVPPKSRAGGGGSFFGIGGDAPDEDFEGIQPDPGGGAPNSEGWNLVPPVTSRATVLYIGPEDMQFPITILEERVTERYVSRPGGRGGGLQPGPGGSTGGIGS